MGKTLKELSEILGVKIDHEVSRGAVQRFSLEIGVAADIQLVYKIINAGSKLRIHFRFMITDLFNRNHLQFRFYLAQTY